MVREIFGVRNHSRRLVSAFLASLVAVVVAVAAHGAVGVCDHSIACERVYPVGQDRLQCVVVGNQILMGPHPEDIRDYVTDTCSILSDPTEAKTCVSDTHCVMP